MPAADDEPTTDGFDYDSETASLKDEYEAHWEDSISVVMNARNQVFDFPDTVSLIECENGTKVYLVGTAHFSKESIDEAVKVISHTSPDFVHVELCRSRAHILITDEEKIKEEVKNINLFKYLKLHGASQGIIQYLLLRLNAYLIETLGMAPGGEFRAAAAEASKLPHCHLVLADRPIAVTLQRAFNSLGPWTKLKLIYALLFSLEPITKEQVEEMKKSDFLEKTLMEMAGDHPELTRVLLDERDMFLAKSIWSTTGMSNYEAATKSADGEVIHRANRLIDKPSSTRLRVPFGDRQNDSSHSPTRSPDARPKSDSCDGVVSKMQSCCPFWPSPSVLPRVVVAIVGIGHVAGIKRYWDTAGTIDQAQLMTVIEPPLSWRVFKWSLRVLFFSTLAAAGYGCVRGACKLSTSVFRIRT